MAKKVEPDEIKKGIVIQNKENILERRVRAEFGKTLNKYISPYKITTDDVKAEGLLRIKKENVSIGYTTGDYEIIDSKIINVIDSEFMIQIDDIKFHFGFIDIKEFKMAKIGVDKEPENGVYRVMIVNFNDLDLGGFFKPMILGTVNGIEYYFNLSGWAIKGKEYDVVIINILRKVDNV